MLLWGERETKIHALCKREKFMEIDITENPKILSELKVYVCVLGIPKGSIRG